MGMCSSDWIRTAHGDKWSHNGIVGEFVEDDRDECEFNVSYDTFRGVPVV